MKAIDLQGCLIKNGYLIRRYDLKKQSISGIDRQIILRVRDQAMKAGFSRETVNAMEMHGIQGRENVSGRLVTAEFVGIQQTWRGGLTMRLYNIEGFSPHAGSTATLRDVVHHGILPYDISIPRIAYEYAKETLLLALDWFDLARAKFGLL